MDRSDFEKNDKANDEPILRISHLKKSYGSLDVLRDINADIHRGEVISIIGPSGTGKSTLLRCLNQLEQPSGGSIIVDNKEILSKGYPVHLLRQRMGMVFQSFNLFEHLTILDNMTHAPMNLLFIGMYSTMSAFCYKYNITSKLETAQQLTKKMLDEVMCSYRPITVRITHSELSDVTALDFMVEHLDASPLSDAQRDALSTLCQKVVEEPTKRGFRIKLIL